LPSTESAVQTLARLDLQILRTLHSLRSPIITYKQTTRINKKQSPNNGNRTKQWHKTNLRFETIAWTTKIRPTEGAGTNLKRFEKNLGLNVTKKPNCKELITVEGNFCEIRKAQGFSCKNAGSDRVDRY
jgi:hypothetical protein